MASRSSEIVFYKDNSGERNISEDTIPAPEVKKWYSLASFPAVKYTYHKNEHSDPNAPLVVFLHGTPGSVECAKYVGNLEKDNILLRLELNLDGCCYGEYPLLGHPEELSGVYWQIVDELFPDLYPSGLFSEKPSREIILMAHSMGAEIAYIMSNQRRVSGVVSIAGVGASYQAAMHPLIISRACSIGVRIPLLRVLVLSFCTWLYVKIFRFPPRSINDDVIYFTQQRAWHRSLPLVRVSLRKMRERKTPLILFFTEDDHLVEPNIQYEVIDLVFGIKKQQIEYRDFKEKYKSDVDGQRLSEEKLPLSRVLKFRKGTHMLNKTQSGIIGPFVADWIKDLRKC